ncbi:response regulator [Desulfovibrio sp. TomC]|uniref:response regulator n=1 Tax=Desulfovibrio sp. TomC TaxID=1562888 RepID=UPI000575C3F7|nr:response regulator [Desulfovibrio sp. TomC]KHK02097.1 response regulator receiver protein [Desulfovibrio sp. TomC]
MNATVLRLLLVDDEAGFTEVLAKRLRRRGLDVTVAQSGSEAMEAVAQGSFDAAVVDFKMADMDGLALLKWLKSQMPGLPVFMLTGHGSGEAAREGLAAGAADYLIKPCDLHELLAKIAAATGREIAS